MDALTIKTVAERTGVSVHTLRQWERRYGVPSPNRHADNRYRLYDDNDIADVLWMRQHIESGISPAQASALLQRQRAPQALKQPVTNQPILATQAAFLAALLKSDEATARQWLDQVFALYAPEQVALQIIEPSMVAIGASWARNEITVSQEHWATNLIRQKLATVLESQPLAPASAPHLLAACAPAEEHELGLLIVTLIARRQGWRTAYLGQGAPLVDVARHVEFSKPKAILVSVTTVPGLVSLLPWLQKENRPRAKVIFGGRLLNALPTLREHIPGFFLDGDLPSILGRLHTLRARSDYWAPSKRNWSAALALQSKRLRIVSDTVSSMMPARLSDVQRNQLAHQVGYATLYLTDALVCALAFEVPELMDMHRAWLRQVMPSRSVSPQALAKHRELYSQALAKSLAKDEMRQVKSLLARLSEN